MFFTQIHLFSLAALSIFTGLIAPCVGSWNISVPYALTNMQYVAFSLLFLISILLLTIHFHFKKVSQIIVGTIIVLILALWTLTIIWGVKSFHEVILRQFSWGWLFLIIGLALLIFGFIKNEEIPQENHKTEAHKELTIWYEKILGIVGFVVLSILTIFVIYVSLTQSSKHESTSELSKQLSDTTLLSSSGITMTEPYTQIRAFSFDRSKDILSFIGWKWNQAIIYPEKTTLVSPDDIAAIKYIGDKVYYIQKNGTILLSGKVIGIAVEETNNDPILLYKNASWKYVLISERGNTEFGGESIGATESIDKILYKSSTDTVIYRLTNEKGQTLYENWKKISETYPSILRFTVSNEGVIMLVTEDTEKRKNIIKNGVPIHTISEVYVWGTLQINGNDYIYAIKNDDDGSYSLIFNWVQIERKLDEIREIFLEKNSWGYSYFGRPQGESRYCFFSRYKWNLCSIDGYMNPRVEADGIGIVYLALRDAKWSIYRDTSEFIKKPWYRPGPDISHDYFYFDPTNPRYYLIIQKVGDTFNFNKMGKIIETKFTDFIDSSISFGYDWKILLEAIDKEGLRIVEI